MLAWILGGFGVADRQSLGSKNRLLRGCLACLCCKGPVVRLRTWTLKSLRHVTAASLDRWTDLVAKSVWLMSATDRLGPSQTPMPGAVLKLGSFCGGGLWMDGLH